MFNVAIHFSRSANLMCDTVLTTVIRKNVSVLSNCPVMRLFDFRNISSVRDVIYNL